MADNNESSKPSAVVQSLRGDAELADFRHPEAVANYRGFAAVVEAIDAATVELRKTREAAEAAAEHVERLAAYVGELPSTLYDYEGDGKCAREVHEQREANRKLIEQEGGKS